MAQEERVRRAVAKKLYEDFFRHMFDDFWKVVTSDGGSADNICCCIKRIVDNLEVVSEFVTDPASLLKQATETRLFEEPDNDAIVSALILTTCGEETSRATLKYLRDHTQEKWHPMLNMYMWLVLTSAYVQIENPGLLAEFRQEATRGAEEDAREFVHQDPIFQTCVSKFTEYRRHHTLVKQNELDDAFQSTLKKDGIISRLAQEITDELGLEDKLKSPDDVLKLLDTSNPNGVLGDVISRVGSKLHERISSQKLSQEDLINEAMEMMSSLKHAFPSSNAGDPDGDGLPDLMQLMKLLPGMDEGDEIDIDVSSIPVNGALLQHQQDSVRWMLSREIKDGKGGILADDMGLGKTYQVVALIKGNPVHGSRSTLIVTVVATLSQWQDVLMQFGGIRAFVVMAGQDFRLPPRVDVVLTTYSVFQRPTVPGCLKRDWGRIVLDEGHTIRTSTSRVCQELTSLIRHNQYRWIVSGTPVQNSQSELSTLLTWVGCREGDDDRKKCIFRRTIPQVLEMYPTSFSLPAIRTRIRYLLFRYPEERRLYFRLTPPEMRRYQNAESAFKASKGAFLQTILRQRQLCTHPQVLLSENSKDSRLRRRMLLDQTTEDEDVDANEEDTACCVPNPEFDGCQATGMTFEELRSLQRAQLLDEVGQLTDEELTLPIPTSDLNSLRVSSSDAAQLLQALREEMMDEDRNDEGNDADSVESQDDDFPTIEDFENLGNRSKYLDVSDPEESVRAEQEMAAKRFQRSTKLDYLCSKLMADYLACRKALVFCQWKMEMKLIAGRMKDAGVPYLQLDGDQKQCQRNCVLYNFEHQPDICVLIIQIRAGGVGLNLQAASRVYITSPDWNPVVELQAIARAHRINQKREVRCTRIVMAGTVEEVNCLHKENEKIEMITRCLQDDDFAAHRMGVVSQKYGSRISRVCMHYHMLEKLRFCDI